MRGKTRWLATGVVAALVLAACGGGGGDGGGQVDGGDGGGQVDGGDGEFAGQTLTVAAWSGPYARSFRDIVVPSFEEQTGATVQIVEEWAEIVDKILAAPEDSPPFDVTVGEGYTMCYGLTVDAFVEVDYSNVPRIEEVSQAFRDADEIDCQDDAYGVPFGYGYTVLGYNEAELGFTPSGWQDLWRDEAQGRIALDQGFFSYALAPAAFVEGIDPGAMEAEGPEADTVFQRTSELDVALWYSAGAQVVNGFQTGDVAIAQMYIEDAQRLAREDPNFGFFIPEEGTMGWVDYYMLVRGTQNKELGEAFLNHLLDPELQSRFAEEHLYYMSHGDYAIPSGYEELYPTDEQELEQALRLFDFDVWLPHYFDETGMYTRLSTELLGQ